MAQEVAMFRILGTVLALGAIVVPTMLARPAAVEAQAADCQFTLGFATLRNMIPEIVGSCIENEWHNAQNGDGLQRTTRGMMVWRKADNWTAYTDGYMTWINGPLGLQSRLNTERFAWESTLAAPGPGAPGFDVDGGGSGSGSAGGGSAPAPTPTPTPMPESPPEISIRLSDDRVDNGETFTVRLESSSSVGIDRMWWWATSTDDDDLRDTHSDNCRSASPCRQSWDVSTTDDGDITFHAKSRDMNGVESEEVTREIRVREPSEPTATPTPTQTPTPTTTPKP
jgi:hypothetical protein